MIFFPLPAILACKTYVNNKSETMFPSRNLSNKRNISICVPDSAFTNRFLQGPEEVFPNISAAVFDCAAEFSSATTLHANFQLK